MHQNLDQHSGPERPTKVDRNVDQSVDRNGASGGPQKRFGRILVRLWSAFGPPLVRHFAFWSAPPSMHFYRLWSAFTFWSTFGPPLVRHLVRAFFLVHALVLPPFGPPFGPRFWCAHLCPPFGPQLSRALGGRRQRRRGSYIDYLPLSPHPPPQGNRAVRVDFPRQMVGTLSHEKQLKDINMHRYTQIPKHILASTT